MILLEDVETPFGNIKIMQCRTDGTFTYYQDRCFHSQATEDGVSTCVYIHVLYEVIRQCAAKRVLLIGCAGGTLATMLSRIGCQVTVVDVNDYSFTIARRYFCMPKEVECITGDGAEYVQKTQREYDAIVIDAFERKANIPDSMTNTSFFESLTRCLSSKGIVLMNIMTAHDKDLTADRIAPRAAEIDETGEFPHDVLEALVAADLHAIHVPEEYGGQGGDALAACIVIEEIARACASGSTCGASSIDASADASDVALTPARVFSSGSSRSSSANASRGDGLGASRAAFAASCAARSRSSCSMS
jgi:protein-L-isoaspartate O-methyltransferase